MEWWDNYKMQCEYYAKHAGLGSIMGDIITIAIGAILVASILPTALKSFYAVDSSLFYFGPSGSSNANDTATIAIFKLLPLFTVLGGLALMLAPVIKHLGGGQ